MQPASAAFGGSTGGLFGGGSAPNMSGTGLGAGTGGLSFPMFADGAPGGVALVGERGPELVNLPRGSQVIPNDKLGGGSPIVMNDNRTISIGAGASLRRWNS